jgi:hypothetical protein
MISAVLLTCSACATAQASLLAREGVLVQAPPGATEDTLNAVLKSRGNPIVAREDLEGAVQLKFKGPLAAVYARVVPAAGAQTRLALYGTGVVNRRDGKSYETANEKPPDWVTQWKQGPLFLLPESTVPDLGDEAVNGTLIELSQAGLGVIDPSRAPPAAGRSPPR